MQACRGVDTRNPQRAELTLLRAAVAVSVLPGLDDCLLGGAIDLAAGVVVALRLACQASSYRLLLASRVTGGWLQAMPACRCGVNNRNAYNARNSRLRARGGRGQAYARP